MSGMISPVTVSSRQIISSVRISSAMRSATSLGTIAGTDATLRLPAARLGALVAIPGFAEPSARAIVHPHTVRTDASQVASAIVTARDVAVGTIGPPEGTSQ